ncbi:hypothetical protein STEG23_028043, partial [Scotinomys teguina]
MSVLMGGEDVDQGLKSESSAIGSLEELHTQNTGELEHTKKNRDLEHEDRAPYASRVGHKGTLFTSVYDPTYQFSTQIWQTHKMGKHPEFGAKNAG